MQARLVARGLEEIDDKLEAGERLSAADGLRLFECPDLLAVGWLANRERERRHGRRTFFNHNIRLEATNVCVASCLFCSFARLQPGDAGAYTMSLEQAWNKLRERADQSLTEVHVVNGLHPDLPFDYYLELLRGFKRIKPDIHLKCFTIHETAHRLGLKSNVTMLYGHIETNAERVDHMVQARDRQDRTDGFQAFIPLAFHPDNNQMRKLPAPTAADTLRVHAVSRLMLDNFPHVKAFWIATGVEVAQTALWFGVDDLDGTVQEERIYHMAGAPTPEVMTPGEITRLITDAGREAVERDTFYNVVSARGRVPA